MKTQLRKVKHYLDILGEHRWGEITECDNILSVPCDYKQGNTPPPLSEFKPFSYGDSWGSGNDSHAWFHIKIDKTAPDMYMSIRTEREGWDADNPQFLVYVNGVARQGIDTNHREIYIGDAESANVYLYAYTGPYVKNAKFYADTRILATDVNKLYYDILYPLQMLDYLDTESAEYAQILYYLYRAVSMLELYEIGSLEFNRSVVRAYEFLEKDFYSDYCRKQTSKVICIGHTHIDCAWLWTLRQTREKVQRSFATVLELMNRYPEYKFMSSQALLYKYLKEESPELYGKVAKKIKEGRWECEGAMWVEADCNLPSGESLVRQILYGKSFFREQFGKDNRILWLPDVFGYSAAMPQILRKSGVDWFVTSKISWNDDDRMPYDTFRWRGIDGSEINSYFLTACDAERAPTPKTTSYNAHTRAQMIAGAYKRYQQKHLSDEALITFGYGDGGGGPSCEHLELARRGARGIPGSPEVGIEFAGDFLSRLEQRMESNPDIPTWQGELYLEFHRGTYTTMHNNKKNNRRSEFLYQDAEMLSVISKELFATPYPKEALHDGWENILTNQFHDIIPGSSIKEVYEQCDKDYAVIMAGGERIINSAKEKIASSIAEKNGYVVFNPHSFCGSGLVKVDGVTCKVSDISPKGYTVTDKFSSECNVRADGRHVSTDTLEVEFDESYMISSIYDKNAKRELIRKGARANELRIYADFPDTYDAWEWQAYSRDAYLLISEVESVCTVKDGVRLGIKIVRPYSKSKITQTVWFTDGTSEIDFETSVDWHEEHKMLKAVFPIDINTDKATYEIQFGSIERPTHFNTSWDRARFEVCAHKYADISDGNFGVSLLNDCKYGHDIHDGVIALSLLRSAKYPNPEADMGECSFVYAISSHKGTLKESDTQRKAYYLNYPMTALRASGKEDLIPLCYSVVAVASDHVIAETVKEAERGCETVVRLYEFKNIRDNVEITVGRGVKRAFICDMMENETEELAVESGKIKLDISGFEIVTLKLM